MISHQTVLEAVGLTKRYGGVVALDDVSFDVRRGEVHTLAGENGSGKSTLIKMVSGVVAPDHGKIKIGDQSFDRLTPRIAKSLGVEVIFQDFSLFPNLSVAENIAMPTCIAKGQRFVRPKEFFAVASAVVQRIGVDMDLSTPVGDLTVADRQLTAICRALAQDAQIIFMDEPTTALTRREVQALFAVVETLKQSGVAMVFVSHKLEEVMQVSERITVLRNGEVTASGDAAEFDRASLIRAMTGRPVSETPPSDSVRSESAPVLSVRSLTLNEGFRDVSFDVWPGEVVGVTGLLGSGRTEIAESLFGILPADSGSVLVDGKPAQARSVGEAVGAGIGYVPVDRLTQGVFLEQSISSNIVAGSVDRLVGPGNLVRQRDANALVDRLAAELRLKMASINAPVRSLSGGNQQRVVLAKWFAREPRVLILNSPTVGVDIGSKSEILEILRAKAHEGMAIVVISDDVPELVAVCHRVLVVRTGRVVDVLDGDRVNEDEILKELVE